MDGCGARRVRRGIQAQAEMLSSVVEWSLVSRLSHTLACSMLIQLHKLPHNYPGGTPRVDRKAKGGESESITDC